jgi:hypothetical protein
MQPEQGDAVDDEHDAGEGDLVVASWRKCSLSKVTLLKVSAANMVSRNDNGNGDGNCLSL